MLIFNVFEAGCYLHTITFPIYHARSTEQMGRWFGKLLMKRRPFGGLPSRRGSQLFRPFPSSRLFLKIAVNGFTLDMSSFGSCLILRNISILMLTRRIFLTRDVLVILILIFIPNHPPTDSHQSCPYHTFWKPIAASPLVFPNQSCLSPAWTPAFQFEKFHYFCFQDIFIETG